MSTTYYWLCLLASIVFEVAGTSVMKLSQETWPLLGMGCMYLLLGLSYFFLARAVVKLPVGVAYAFWEGLGLTLITIVSVTLLDERLDAMRLAALGMVLAGTLLVHHGTAHGRDDEEAEAASGGEGRI
ncbi:DMT family transporter [Nitratidesulfovibrio vulgaris]|jgi:spermidine export protein MdtJ|uniref:Spermidine export protein MdtJ n=1 Tax=Nitratidesulfovibrio vulgaris (strain ATCC 29579 / DSM 644 / CCUG 34227 / NCIMB 8303 / VKM B-1760 / Hildenborough) TaxID=882 RepID=Q725U8_NITV2|nr:multidrug efflux SMR transporter [Nitratidesulfovibrio vulgaris]AAS97795.1 multidrug resistance protein, Smr family [Nitratidesulfovibrio vulgaris str. Hildenborough]ADP88214.1 small multidrug resistance protein [Nitratidesulfovibrio vulgaris RCH1]WCB46704.1 multidrug efflux SMR transporter [Nitratidesulfovibrio vulgaris]